MEVVNYEGAAYPYPYYEGAAYPYPYIWSYYEGVAYPYPYMEVVIMKE